MKQVASLWIGERLGKIELLSIASFLRTGHSFTLYSYVPIANAPAGVITADAASILPATMILRYRRNNSPAIHADVFRYAMLRQIEAIWVDLDIIALRPFDFPSTWVFGYEDGVQLNNAVLGLPQDSKLLSELSSFTLETRGVPPHLTGLRRQKYRLRSWMRGGLPISDWPWGSTGPRALTYFARQTGEIHHAMPLKAFYPVPQNSVLRFLEPGATRPEDFTGSFGVHLWAKDLRQALSERFGGEVPRHSFLDLVASGVY